MLSLEKCCWLKVEEERNGSCHSCAYYFLFPLSNDQKSYFSDIFFCLVFKKKTPKKFRT